MNELGLLFLNGLISCSGPYKSVVIEKPSPCYRVESVERRGRTAEVRLVRERELCPQVITTERIKVERDIEKIRVILDNKVWKEFPADGGKQ
ncbi:MAG: hypothetical protein GXN96_04680 [Aquificae bacterium]|nr:hypothetical protein [Aquificota bacterium]